MNTIYIRPCIRGTLIAGLLGSVQLAMAQNAPPAPAGQPASPSEQMQILESGPLHEAFAQPVDLKPGPGMTAPKEPPPPIEELPASVKPEGDPVWIRGYWAWDEGRDDFVWVSGLWRIPPEGRQWVDGRWEKTDVAFTRISGYWAPLNAADPRYFEEPPASLEQGPNSPAPSDNYFWVPGNWQWGGNRYLWQAGYWFRAYPGWTWIPNSYCWTPRGYAYVPGYWDYYPVTRRGWLYAPVYFGPNFPFGSRYAYRPSSVLDTRLLLLNLFVGPRFGNYYFGDYYGQAYLNAGFNPWFRYSWNRPYYDPFFAYNHWYFGRFDRDWQRRLTGRYDRLAADENIRRRDLWRPTDLERGVAPERRDQEVVRLVRPATEFARDGRAQQANRRDALESVVGRPPPAIEQADRAARTARRADRDTRGEGAVRRDRGPMPEGRQLDQRGGAPREDLAPPPPSRERSGARPTESGDQRGARRVDGERPSEPGRLGAPGRGGAGKGGPGKGDKGGKGGQGEGRRGGPREVE